MIRSYYDILDENNNGDRVPVGADQQPDGQANPDPLKDNNILTCNY